MLSISSFFNRDMVVMKLIKSRCKSADRKKEQDQVREFIHPSCLSRKPKKDKINDLFPPRKKWVGLGMKDRYLMDSMARNERRLKYTYLKAKAQDCREDWYVRLCQYADSIVKYAYVNDLGLQTPKVCAIFKENDNDNKKAVYRPICKFPEIDKIVLSILNNYLTILFDDYFYDCSYAFRKVNGARSQLQHLDAVRQVRDYRLDHLNQSLFVAECDMKKFYDTISHHVIKVRFIKLLQRAKRDGKISSQDVRFVKRWFFAYIDCFDFLSHVWVKNKFPRTHPIWTDIRQAPEDFQPEISFLNKKKDAGFNWRLARTKKGRVGVPQGGALSGLIANIVMHDVDEAVIRAIAGRDLLYCRFCDDMVLIGVKRAEVLYCYRQYEQAIRDSRLVAHENRPVKSHPMKKFWKGKTRGPYQWNEKGEQIFPWITFVGFDVNWKGNLRIRKKSYKRQMAKQTQIANELLLPYLRGGKPRYCSGTILESLSARLRAAGIGRVSFDDYQHNPNIHSWVSAFSILDKNPWSVRQIKALDRHRETVLTQARHKLNKISCSSVSKRVNTKDYYRMLYAYKGCPFSYYGQCFVYK